MAGPNRVLIRLETALSRLRPGLHFDARRVAAALVARRGEAFFAARRRAARRFACLVTRPTCAAPRAVGAAVPRRLAERAFALDRAFVLPRVRRVAVAIASLLT
ncbi:MAG: hypothetical protein L6R19_00425 [Alphaproteobacteria bacterium]|nr:hypothetical protein [Alphaproteobacteria bacterium]